MAEDADLQAAHDAAFKKLRNVLPTGSPSRVQDIVTAIDALIDVKLAIFIEMLADRAAALRDEE